MLNHLPLQAGILREICINTTESRNRPGQTRLSMMLISNSQTQGEALNAFSKHSRGLLRHPHPPGRFRFTMGNSGVNCWSNARFNNQTISISRWDSLIIQAGIVHSGFLGGNLTHNTCKISSAGRVPAPTNPATAGRQPWQIHPVLSFPQL
ncbi:MAG: hypothetical protein CM1200mP30_16600 [Pseudomonadota bacterium]|nr:MAG: hypothetical protein CM1200mP30_16600 [Pseudomonadota bacterium]